MAPGQKLIYADLAAKLKMSKTPAISPLSRLESEGYVYLKPNAGYHIQDMEVADILQALRNRELLEMANMDAVMEHISEADFLALERLHEADRKDCFEFFDRERIRSNREFHTALAGIGRNKFILRFINYVNEWMGPRLNTVIPATFSRLRVLEGADDRAPPPAEW